MKTEHTPKDSLRRVLWDRLKKLFMTGSIFIPDGPLPAPRLRYPRKPIHVTPKKALTPTESITVSGYTEASVLAFKRALIRAGCPHVRIAAQYSQGLISATIPEPKDRARLELCIMKAGLIPIDMEGRPQ